MLIVNIRDFWYTIKMYFKMLIMLNVMQESVIRKD